MSIQAEPIDAVITWVDGYDMNHQNKLNQYLDTLKITRPVTAAPTRFNQCNEIYYCVHALLRFAPWLRRIYIITDEQSPAVVAQLHPTVHGEKITVIDHKTIFKEYLNCLPTFNSLSIETVIDRIPGLSKHFIYLNDDCIIIKPVKPTDFFLNNKVVARGYWKTQFAYQWIKRLLKLQRPPELFRQVQEHSARLAGWARAFFYLHHAPCALRKQTLQQFYQQHPSIVDENCQFRLRDPAQFWPVSLAYHLEFKEKNVKVDSQLHAVMVNGATHSQDKISCRLEYAELHRQVAFICIQSLDEAPAKQQQFITQWLERLILQDNINHDL